MGSSQQQQPPVAISAYFISSCSAWDNHEEIAKIKNTSAIECSHVHIICTLLHTNLHHLCAFFFICEWPQEYPAARVVGTYRGKLFFSHPRDAGAPGFEAEVTPPRTRQAVRITSAIRLGFTIIQLSCRPHLLSVLAGK